ncbi:MAG: hypothetical protein M3Z36_02940 [Acidobacteriota bacterium]|nr:hypothetical protein [Acidobacteriota bacterium]
MKYVCTALLCACSAVPFLTAQTADEIMARVAANQDRAQSVRSTFVYRQNLLVRMKRANGKLAREEIRDYTVTPAEDSSNKELTHVAGKYEKDGKLFEYSKPEFRHKDIDMDGEIMESLADDFANDGKSRDGIDRDMFPLTAKHQRGYNFHLHGREKYKDAEVFRIAFEPKAKEADEDNCWAGEALIDAGEFQPVLVTTHLAKGIPLLVKTLLGTDLKQVGFKVSYREFDEGLWFPVSYGGELKVRALFLYARSLSISVVNSDFQRTKVQSAVSFDKPVEAP